MRKSDKRELVEQDMRGQVCPSSLLVAMDSINTLQKELRKGSVRLKIKTDNRDSINTIPQTAESMGYQSHVSKKDGYYEILIGCETTESSTS